MKNSAKIQIAASVEIKAQFYDIDPMNVVWHGHYARFFEEARCALLDKIDYSYGQMKASGYAWPVIDMHIRYIRPIMFGQVVVVTAEVVEYEYRLRILYVIRDKHTGERLTKGRTDQVAVDLEHNEMLLTSPSILLEKLGVA